jgi:hypothetical protein
VLISRVEDQLKQLKACRSPREDIRKATRERAEVLRDRQYVRRELEDKMATLPPGMAADRWVGGGCTGG